MTGAALLFGRMVWPRLDLPPRPRADRQSGRQTPAPCNTPPGGVGGKLRAAVQILHPRPRLRFFSCRFLIAWLIKSAFLRGIAMHLQGRELVSAATQRAARQLVATALTVLLAKVYELDLKGLEVFGVAIDPAIVEGAAVIVVAFQLATFLVHWCGDLASLAPWNSPERVGGFGRISAGAKVLDHIGQTEERLANIEQLARVLLQREDQGSIDRLSEEVRKATATLSDLRRSVRGFGRYAAFYFYGLYLALPVVLAAAALLWPSPNAAPVHP